MDEDDAIALKFIIIGASGGGKTSILLRLTSKTFQEDIESTVGMEYRTYNMVIRDQHVKLMLWDTAGQERFYTISRAYFRGALGVILVFDICDRRSFDQLPRWLRDARIEADPSCTVMLVGNKVDLDSKRCVSRSEAEEFAKQNDLIYEETSALSNTNVEEMFTRAATDIVDRVIKGEIGSMQMTKKEGMKSVNLDMKWTEVEKKLSCCK